jgi:hypothetical protein
MIIFVWFSKIVVCLIYNFMCLVPFSSVLSFTSLNKSPARNKLPQGIGFPPLADVPRLPSQAEINYISLLYFKAAE